MNDRNLTHTRVLLPVDNARELNDRERARHLREGISIDRSICDALLAAADR